MRTRPGIVPYKGIFPTLGDDVYVAPCAWIVGDVQIGNRSSVWFNTVIRGDVNIVRIGRETNIQDNATLHVTGKKYPLFIGDRVTIGHRAVVHVGMARRYLEAEAEEKAIRVRGFLR